MNDLSLVTGIKFTKEALKQLNAITFAYDPSWKPDSYEVPTLPASFFHVKKMNEIMHSEVSKRQMLFYNSDRKQLGSTVDGSVLNVVADNIVIEPKTYRFELVVPYSDLSLVRNTYVFNPAMVLEGVYSTNTIAPDGWGQNIFPLLNLNNLWLSILNNIFDSLLNLSKTSSAIDNIKNYFVTPEYNKNALEAMWKGRKIIKMKMFNSWKYKYLVITDFDITKEGTEDGVYEATMTCQEIPIMTYRNNSIINSAVKAGYKNTIAEALGKTMIKAFDALE